MKFPRVARLDDTDEHVYTRAAAVGEPAIPGTFAYTFSDEDPVRFEGKRKQAFRHGFLGLESFGRCTVVTVSEMDEAEYKSVVERLAHHLVSEYGAPNLGDALPVAREEVEYAAGLCEHELNTVLAVERTISGDGEIHETFKVIQPKARWEGQAVQIWAMEPEEKDPTDGGAEGPPNGGKQ